MNIPPLLSSFFQAYMECALWSSVNDNGCPLDREYTPQNIAPEHAEKMLADCQRFYADNEINAFTDREQKLAGHDFWLTRNGHGAGFWDGTWEEPYATLFTVSAHSFGSDELYVGDDGEIYGTPTMVIS